MIIGGGKTRRRFSGGDRCEGEGGREREGEKRDGMDESHSKRRAGDSAHRDLSIIDAAFRPSMYIMYNLLYHEKCSDEK